MNTHTRSHPVFILAAFLAITVLITSACSFLTPRFGEISQIVEISLDEQMFLDARPTFRVHNHDFWEELDVVVNRMELHEGYIRFLGFQRQADGSLADCTIDVALSAGNGGLTARIISMDVPGLSLSDPLVVSINRDLQTMLTLTTYDNSANIQFQEVKVTEDTLYLKILVNVRF